MTRLVRGAVGLALVFASSAASAQGSDQDAERLFREGQQQMEQRNFGLACPKFEAAYKIDRQLGTLINLAFCHKEQGSIWYAWLEFREAEVKATELNRNDRKDFVRQKLTELEKDDTLAKVIVDNPQRTRIDEIQVEDRKVPEAERGAIFVVETGRRRFTFKAKGKKPAAMLVNVTRGNRPQHIQLPEFEDAPPEPPPVVKPPPVEPERTTPPEKPTPGATQRTVGWIVAGASVPLFVVGAIFGINVLSATCKKKEECPTTFVSTDGKAAVSTAMFVAGGVVAVTGITLVLTAPTTPSSSAVTISPKIGAGWAGLTGTF